VPGGKLRAGWLQISVFEQSQDNPRVQNHRKQGLVLSETHQRGVPELKIVVRKSNCHENSKEAKDDVKWAKQRGQGEAEQCRDAAQRTGKMPGDFPRGDRVLLPSLPFKCCCWGSFNFLIDHREAVQQQVTENRDPKAQFGSLATGNTTQERYRQRRSEEINTLQQVVNRSQGFHHP